MSSPVTCVLSLLMWSLNCDMVPPCEMAVRLTTGVLHSDRMTTWKVQLLTTMSKSAQNAMPLQNWTSQQCNATVPSSSPSHPLIHSMNETSTFPATFLQHPISSMLLCAQQTPAMQTQLDFKLCATILSITTTQSHTLPSTFQSTITALPHAHMTQAIRRN